MSANTAIEWCDHSWSPWRGCTKVSPGCANCYAETLSKRNPAVLGQWGKGKPRVMAKNWREPLKWQAAFDDFGDDPQRHATVFPSLCDWLDDEVPVEWLAKFLSQIHDTPNLRWLLLTKRPDDFGNRLTLVCATAANHCNRVAEAMALEWINGLPPANVWVGTSVEDQDRAHERIPALLRIPAAGRFLSVEPLLGSVDLERRHRPHSPDGRPLWPTSEPMLFGIDWVIIGGESGRGARPCKVEWIRSLVRQCRGAGVPPFVKQLGARPSWLHLDGTSRESKVFTHSKGGDPAEWPDDLRVREFPEDLR